jgi:hypothetical protein
MGVENSSKEENGAGGGEKANSPDPVLPWCSKCAKHTEGREKLFDLFAGKNGHGPRSFRCDECGKTMWAPVDCRNSGRIGTICVLFGLAGMVATLFAVRTSLGTPTTVYMVAMEGLIVLYFYCRYRKQKLHLEKFKGWSKRKKSVYGS